MTMPSRYTMTISRLTVDKLGVKLYDRVSAVIAELIANCYDADATEVEVVAPMGQFLANNSGGKITDKGYRIEVRDNGSGMNPAEINPYYLKVGAERRSDIRGEISPILKRKVMGRKGVGKLAPFGICQNIELTSSGGTPADGRDEKNNKTTGYLTANFTLERGKILKDTDDDYHPAVGPLDDVVRAKPGTIIALTKFDYRRVPDIDDLARQLSQRFGIASPKWKITLIDSLKANTDPNHRRVVGAFDADVAIMSGTKIRLEQHKKNGEDAHRATGPDGDEMADLQAGFTYDGKFYPIVGWVAYSKLPYKDDLMAGVRVYCRGKIAAQTRIFNMGAGFTGEYDIRSYLVGRLDADWLDESEDLIRTDRQDILWSHELGSAFEKWGQTLVKKLGVLTRQPKRKNTWERFQEKSKIGTVVETAFPAPGEKAIRENTMEIAKTIAQSMREEEISDPEFVQAMVQLSLLLGPHITLDKKLREAAEEQDDALSTLNSILKTARIAELAGFGRIADDRIKVIAKVEDLKDKKDTLEAAFQDLIEAAPWLIDPQWSPVAANQTFSTLKKEFEKYYKHKTGKELVLERFSESDKRADFVLSNQDARLEIVEIKKPGHSLANEEMDRIVKYVDLMTEFLETAGNDQFRQLFPEFHVTLVCDKVSLDGVHRKAFESLKKEHQLTHITWTVFLVRARKTHEDFLNEADRQKKIATKTF